MMTCSIEHELQLEEMCLATSLIRVESQTFVLRLIKMIMKLIIPFKKKVSCSVALSLFIQVFLATDN